MNGAILVYDVTNKASFAALNDWITEFRKYMPEPQDMGSVPFVVCANKVQSVNVLLKVYVFNRLT